jgi:hypothetical protein
MPAANSTESTHIVSLTPDEVKEVLRHNITNNQYLEGRGRDKVSVELKGDSGIGKTALSDQIIEELHLSRIKLNLAMLEELGDVVGYPIRQFKAFKDGDERWIDEQALDFFVKHLKWELTGDSRMGYAPPFWIADNKKSGGVLQLDDWTRGETRFIQAVMELVQKQEYISWKLPPNWHIILTSNPDNGEFQVNTTDRAQRTRYISQPVKFDIHSWARWAEEAGVDGRCINFFISNPEIVENKEINARSMTMFFDSISSLPDFESERNLSLITLMGNGSIGTEATLLFVEFVHNKLDKLISPEEILDLKQNEKSILNKLYSLTHDGRLYRADVANIISTRLINYLTVYAKTNPVPFELTKRIRSVLTGENKIFQTDIIVNAVKQIVSSSNKYQSLSFDKSMIEYMAK